MSQFSRTTLYEAYMLLGRRIQLHGDFEDLMYRWELDDFAEHVAGAIHVRLRQVFRHLKDNPDAQFNDRSLIDLFVEEALSVYPCADYVAGNWLVCADGSSVDAYFWHFGSSPEWTATLTISRNGRPT